ncbi:MAG: hypothetical protein ACAH89_15405 [Rariglobus sp.]|nr:hypothetical protein [Rariglobus sp.]
MNYSPAFILKRLLLTAALLGSTGLSAAEPSAETLEIALGSFNEPTPWHIFLGAEFPGAKGTLSQRLVEEKTTGVLAFDFTGGGSYIAARSPVDIPDRYTEIRFKVRSDKKQRVTLRLADSTGQYHQIPLAYETAGEWQTLRLVLTGLRSKTHFFGKNDGTLHFPVKELWIMVQKGTESTTGELLFTDVKALP